MKDCFSCPQPQDVESVEGCPVLHLSDSALDIENFCALLYGVYRYVLNIIDALNLLSFLVSTIKTLIFPT